MSLKKKVFKGLGALSLLQIISRIIKPLFSILTMRILVPNDYGTIAIAYVIIGGLKRFEQFGINIALIRVPELSDEVKNNAFTLKIIISFMLFCTAFLISDSWAKMYNNPGLSAVIKLLGIIFIINSFSFIDNVVSIREMKFNLQLFPEVSAVFAISIFTYLFAILGFGYWSIVYGTLSSTIIKALIYKAIFRERNSFEFNPITAKNLLNFGFWTILGSLFFWGFTTIDNAMIGKFLGSATLGYYVVAYKWGTFSAEQTQPLLSKILLPAYSQMQNDNVRIKNNFLKIVKISAIFSFPISFGLFSVSDIFIKVLLGNKWSPVIQPLMILSILGLIRSLQSSGGSIFYAKNKPHINAFLSGISFFIVSIFIYPVLLKFGINGVAFLVTIAYIISVAVQFYLVMKLLKIHNIELLNGIWLPAISSLFMLLVVIKLKSLFHYNIINFIIIVILGGVVYLSMLFLLSKGKIFKEIFEMIK